MENAMRKYVRNGAIASMAVGNNASAFVANPMHQLISSRTLKRSRSDSFGSSPKAPVTVFGVRACQNYTAWYVVIIAG